MAEALEDDRMSTESSDDEDNSHDPKWTLFSQREEWKDVTPVPQDDGPHPVVAICYTKTFQDAYDYFRAILKTGEISERVLELTEACISLNPANYTVWEYRREVLKELRKDLKEELRYIQDIIKKHPKNYQVWHHRKIIVESLDGSDEELSFTDLIFKQDAKNYHSWQYRQWYIQTYNAYDGELEYADSLLEKDIRNNSAWNQRYFVLQNTTKFEPEVIDREVDYALAKITIVKKNESAWSYLKGVLSHDKIGGLGSNAKVVQKCKEWFELGNKSNHLLACIIDIVIDRFEKGKPMDDFYNPAKAIEVCEMLEDTYDKVRKNYWQYMRQRIKKMFGDSIK